MDAIKYLVVSPVRNESDYIERTLKSMISQQIKPHQWIIVDDGSTDDTREIAERYAAEHDWITVMGRLDRGYHEPGRGVIQAFYDGYEARGFDDFDYVVKLDADLTFESDYFSGLFEKFAANPKLGLASGVCWIERNGQLQEEKHPSFHTRGPATVYKRACWDQIGGLVKHLGWDTIDEIKAWHRGWESRSFAEIKIIHHRITGLNSGVWGWQTKLGRSDYYCGYHPLFIIAKSAGRFFRRPYFRGSLGILWGYFSQWFTRAELLDDPAIVRFIRHEQIKKLTFRKSLWQ